jgi:hypothetical protein
MKVVFVKGSSKNYVFQTNLSLISENTINKVV